MNHSILDGRTADTFADPVPAGTRARPTVAACMTRPAVAVTPDTDFATVVAALTASRRGVLPVVAADGTVAGVVAASDLLAAYAHPETGGSRVLARHLMTSPPITVTEDQDLAQALAVLDRHALHHLPVVDGKGRLTGLLSPHDLLDALRREDEAIRDEALALALTPGTGVVPGSLHVRCERGHVTLAGRTRTHSDAAALCLQTARIDGLVRLTERLTWAVEDTADTAETADTADTGSDTDSEGEPVALPGPDRGQGAPEAE
ncbi:CBS domain-containing protein [Kitasatospora camelliae]|uniref:CBS domain-containing protein n=1 Tax=Kitasatospora camelliae TaxID=3156397 RepID=A0AAU8JSZ5_9ACTN